eukprot:scaffold70139_cov19-Prasinocladus_malaysianus.AAC.1
MVSASAGRRATTSKKHMTPTSKDITESLHISPLEAFPSWQNNHRGLSGLALSCVLLNWYEYEYNKMPGGWLLGVIQRTRPSGV